jgi:TolA-binding protein
LPPTIETEFAAGWAAVRTGDHPAAAAHFAAAVAAAPDAALAEDARYWRAVSLTKARRTAAAARAMSHFLSAHPRSARAGEIAVMLGWIELEQNRPAAARGHFRAGLSDPSQQVRSSAQAGLRAVDGR